MPQNNHQRESRELVSRGANPSHVFQTEKWEKTVLQNALKGFQGLREVERLVVLGADTAILLT